MKQDCSAIILSAGKSERMKQHKAFLLFDKEKNIDFIGHLVDVYSKFGCAQIIVVFNPENIKFSTISPARNLKIIVNKEYEKGRFSSISLAAKNVYKNNFCFIQNIDNPFTTVELLEKLYGQKENFKYVSPVFDGKGGHPILLSPEIITQIQMQKLKNLNLRQFMQLFERKNVLINDKHILTNINTIEEYKLFFK